MSSELLELCGAVPWAIVPLTDRRKQFVSSVVGVSSQYGVGVGQWGADNLVGEPTVYPAFGDEPNAWAPQDPGGREFLEVRLAEPVVELELIEVYETFNGGAVQTISVRAEGQTHWTPVFEQKKRPSHAATKAQIFAPKLDVAAARGLAVRDIRLDIVSLSSAWYEVDAIAVTGQVRRAEQRAYIPPAPGTLAGDFLALLLAGDGDVFFVTPAGDRLPAHRAVLRARCPALCPQPGSNSATVMIREDRAVFEKVLMYVYSGDALVVPAQLIPVYACALRLGLTALADKCSVQLATALSPDNVVAVLKIVEGMPALRSVCFKFMAERLKEIAVSGSISALSAAESHQLLLQIAGSS